MSYPLPKDPREAIFLNRIRNENKRMASKCYICKKQSTGINADKHRVVFVCKDHLIEYNPHVVHRIYVDGLEVPEHMMNPDIGGNFRKKENNNDIS